MEHLTQFQGASGALIVSFIAFTIVFIVLAGLTAVIYAIKLFAGNDEKKDQNKPSATTPAVVVPASAGKSQITAAITAAILVATQGRGKILNIVPANSPAGNVAFERTRIWKSTGIVERVSGRLARSWKH